MKTFFSLLTLLAVTVAAFAAGRRFEPRAEAGAPAPVERGRYLVQAMGCADCHTPLTLGPNGPEPDAARAFSGHPEQLEMPPAPEMGAGPWVASVAGTNTAWAGPWGVSFTSNLTPDDETGLGKWDETMFFAAMRKGRHLGFGRPLLPPMPWQSLAGLDEEDLRAVFAYLKSLPALHNRVPEPVPPRG